MAFESKATEPNDSDTYVYHAAPDEPLPEVVVRATARASGRPAAGAPNALPPLYDSLDPDALDALVESSTALVVTFEYGGHSVTVDASGRVTVTDR